MKFVNENQIEKTLSSKGKHHSDGCLDEKFVKKFDLLQTQS